MGILGVWGFWGQGFLGFGVEALGFGVRALGLRVWGSGFGICAGVGLGGRRGILWESSMKGDSAVDLCLAIAGFP